MSKLLPRRQEFLRRVGVETWQEWKDLVDEVEQGRAKLTRAQEDAVVDMVADMASRPWPYVATCERCGDEFEDRSGGRARFCGVRCRVANFRSREK